MADIQKVRYFDVLRQLRLRRGVRQKELASRAGVDPTFLCGLERGRRSSPSLHLIVKLADALEVTHDERLGLMEAFERDRLISVLENHLGAAVERDAIQVFLRLARVLTPAELNGVTQDLMQLVSTKERLALLSRSGHAL